MIPSISRIVHYILPNGEHRPAMIVRHWGGDAPGEETSVQLAVFIDGTNDNAAVAVVERGSMVIWRTSVVQDPTATQPGTWHEPERIEQPAPSLVPAGGALTREEIYAALSQVGQHIEAGGCDPELTKAVTLVSDMMDAIGSPFQKSCYQAITRVRKRILNQEDSA